MLIAGIAERVLAIPRTAPTPQLSLRLKYWSSPSPLYIELYWQGSTSVQTKGVAWVTTPEPWTDTKGTAGCLFKSQLMYPDTSKHVNRTLAIEPSGAEAAPYGLHFEANDASGSIGPRLVSAPVLKATPGIMDPLARFDPTGVRELSDIYTRLVLDVSQRYHGLGAPLSDPSSSAALARPPPARQTARKGRLNFLYAYATSIHPLVSS